VSPQKGVAPKAHVVRPGKSQRRMVKKIVDPNVHNHQRVLSKLTSWANLGKREYLMGKHPCPPCVSES